MLIFAKVYKSTFVVPKLISANRNYVNMNFNIYCKLIWQPLICFNYLQFHKTINTISGSLFLRVGLQAFPIK